MGSKSSKTSQSRDQQKLHAYYQPTLNETKMQAIHGQARRLKIRYITKGFLTGFILEYFLGTGKIYQNIYMRSTMRRLNAKRKEDEETGRRLEAKGELKLQSKAV